MKSLKPAIQNFARKLEGYSNAYYNTGEPLIPDSDFDTRKELLRKLCPSHPFLTSVGALPNCVLGEKGKLPAIMGSLNKLRPSQLYKWASELGSSYGATFSVSPKLDGMSLLLHYHNGHLKYAYTRGNGVLGRNVTARAIHCGGVQQKLEGFRFEGDLIIKGELVIPLKKFKHYPEYKHARNFTSGVINRKTFSKQDIKMLSDLMFVAFSVETLGSSQVINNRKKVLLKNKTDQLVLLSQCGIPTIANPRPSTQVGRCYSQTIKLDGLDRQGILGVMSQYSDLDLLQDGLVVEVKEESIRRELGYKGMCPEWAVAVKLDAGDQKSKQGKVKQVYWNFTKRRILKPLVILEKPLDFDGVNVTNITAHNAKYVADNFIGKGASLNIIRSGDVIPYIVSVHEKAPNLHAPKECPHCSTPLKWTEVDLYCPNKGCSGASCLLVSSFFQCLGVDNVGDAILSQLYQNGYDTVSKVLSVCKEDLMGLESFGERRSALVLEALTSSVTGIELANVMHASGCFSSEKSSLGVRKLKVLLSHIDPSNRIAKKGMEFFSINRKKLYKKCASCKGFSFISTQLFIDGIDDFCKFYKTIEEKVDLIFPDKGSNVLEGRAFAITGFRDLTLQGLIESNGGKITGVNKRTVAVFAKGESLKVTKARDLDVPVVQQKDAISYLTSLL